MCDIIIECCRLCLDTNSQHVSILKDSSIQIHMKSCLGISISENDILPKLICSSCVAQLKEFYKYQLNSKYSQDWLSSVIREKPKKVTEHKILIQPLPDSEYNSDSLLDFLNNTENIDEYLNSLGKEDIPSIDKLIDKNCDLEISTKSPKKQDKSNYNIMELDVLDSHVDIVKEILQKENHGQNKSSFNKLTGKCVACKMKFDNVQKWSRHLSVCDNYARFCSSCNMLFDSKLKLNKHRSSFHTSIPCLCSCGQHFTNRDLLLAHYKECNLDFATNVGYEFHCKECGCVFKDRMAIYKHAKEHIMKAEMKLCNECGHNFVGETALSLHKNKMHPVPDNVEFRCKVCHKKSQDRRELYNHIRKEHSSALEPQRHLCDFCGRSFATRASLMRHVMTHGSNSDGPPKKVMRSVTDEGVSMCECCGEMVGGENISSHLQSHMSINI